QQTDSARPPPPPPSTHMSSQGQMQNTHPTAAVTPPTTNLSHSVNASPSQQQHQAQARPTLPPSDIRPATATSGIVATTPYPHPPQQRMSSHSVQTSMTTSPVNVHPSQQA